MPPLHQTKLPVLLGSSRADGNTRHLIDKTLATVAHQVVDLSALQLSPYDYTHKNKEDDFLPLIESLRHHSAFVLATPVYWYTMSTQMKMFFDRLTDLMTVRKNLGRTLSSKTVYGLISSNNNELPPGFEWPFAETFPYLKMVWGGLHHVKIQKNGTIPSKALPGMNQFSTRLAKS